LWSEYQPLWMRKESRGRRSKYSGIHAKCLQAGWNNAYLLTVPIVETRLP
jgi:hypothetical protein